MYLYSLVTKQLTHNLYPQVHIQRFGDSKTGELVCVWNKLYQAPPAYTLGTPNICFVGEQNRSETNCYMYEQWSLSWTQLSLSFCWLDTVVDDLCWLKRFLPIRQKRPGGRVVSPELFFWPGKKLCGNVEDYRRFFPPIDRWGLQGTPLQCC